MSGKMRFWLVSVAVMLLVSGLGCSICPLIPEKSTPTPSETPRPTVTPTLDVGDMEFFYDPTFGLSLLYPESWVHESDGWGWIIFAEDDDALWESDPERDPLFVVEIIAPEDLEDYGDVDTTQDLMDTASDYWGALESGCTLDDATPISFGDTPGARAEGVCSDPSIYFLIGIAYSENAAAIIVAATPDDEWDEHSPVLEAMFESVEISAPQQPESEDKGQIAPGETVEDYLASGAIHSWYFTVDQDTYVTIALNAFDTDNLDPFLTLYDENDIELTSDDDGGDGLNSLIFLFPIPATGSYEIQVSAWTGSGDYSLSLSTLSDIPEGGGPIGYGDVVTATLLADTENEWTFDGQQGDQVTIEMIARSGDLYPSMSLYGPDDQFLTGHIDSGTWEPVARIEFFELPEAGTYTIVCSSSYESAGFYELTLGLSEFELLSIGDTVTGMVEPGERDSWLFDGTAGDSVTILLIADDNDFDTYLELFGPDGSLLITDDDSGGGHNSLLDEYSLSTTGTYRIVVHGFSADDEGGYELSLTSP